MCSLFLKLAMSSSSLFKMLSRKKVAMWRGAVLKAVTVLGLIMDLT